MKHAHVTLLVIMTTLLTLTSCSLSFKSFKNKIVANGPRVEMNLNVAKFNAIKVSVPFDVHYVQGNTETIKVLAPQSIIDHLTTKVDQSTLSIGLNGNLYSFKGKVDIWVTAPQLNAVTLIGSGDFDASQVKTGGNFMVQLRGSGDIEIGQVTTHNATINMSGSGDIKIGRLDCSDVAASVAGSGDIKANVNGARKVDYAVKGSGDITSTLTNCGNVACRVKGSGDITLSGNVASLDKQVNGSGDIHARRLSIQPTAF